MKITQVQRRLVLTALIVGGLSSMATGEIITQVETGGYPSWDMNSTWVGNAKPADTVDSVVINSRIYFKSDLILGADQTMTQTASPSWFIDSGTFDNYGSVSLDCKLGAGNTTSAKDITLRAGSAFSIGTGLLEIDDSNWTTTWIADSDGVTDLQAGTAKLTGSAAVIDLTNYDLASGTDIVLMTADEGTTTFGSVTLLGGYTADIDYAYNGNTQIALTNVVPEPATLGLISASSLIILCSRRFLMM